MIYGDQKIRNMGRSILPAKERKRVRENAATLKRKHRHNMKQTLNEWARWEDPNEFEGFIYDYADAPAMGHNSGYMIDSWKGGNTIKGLMWDRRDNDNLGPILRWAKAIAPRLGNNPVERYFAIKKYLPDNLIGRHALGHIRQLDEYNRPNEYSCMDNYWVGYENVFADYRV